MRKIKCCIFVLLSIKIALAGQFTREELTLANKYCVQEFMEDISSQFERRFPKKYVERQPVFNVISDNNKIWLSSFDLRIGHAEEEWIRWTKFKFELKKGMLEAIWPIEMVFSLIPLPEVTFKVVKASFDEFGRSQPSWDRLQIQKIMRPEGPDLEPLVNPTTKQASIIMANKKKYLDCLGQLLNNPPIETAPVPTAAALATDQDSHDSDKIR